MAGKTIIDSDSGEVAEYEECRVCEGMGGFDVSQDEEAYDEWVVCEECSGEGKVEIGHFDIDTFLPERDAYTPND